jgi:hypothetical protein
VRHTLLLEELIEAGDVETITRWLGDRLEVTPSEWHIGNDAHYAAGRRAGHSEGHGDGYTSGHEDGVVEGIVNGKAVVLAGLAAFVAMHEA